MESELVTIILLAVIQGITEFLPISSSGHLVIFQNLLGINEENLLIAVVLHAGTLVSIVVYYFKDILDVFKRENWRIILLIIVGTSPLILGGLVIKPILEQYYGSLSIAAAGLFMTSIMLIVVHRGTDCTKSLDEMKYFQAFIIGIFQCIAIIPGVSRSGSTISVATRFGFKHQVAAKFSFFLGIIAILGANVLTAFDIFEELGNNGSAISLSITAGLVGFVVSFVVGYYSLKILIHTLTKNKISIFGYYCILLSASICVFLFLR